MRVLACVPQGRFLSPLLWRELLRVYLVALLLGAWSAHEQVLLGGESCPEHVCQIVACALHHSWSAQVQLPWGGESCSEHKPVMGILIGSKCDCVSFRQCFRLVGAGALFQLHSSVREKRNRQLWRPRGATVVSFHWKHRIVICAEVVCPLCIG